MAKPRIEFGGTGLSAVKLVLADGRDLALEDVLANDAIVNHTQFTVELHPAEEASRSGAEEVETGEESADESARDGGKAAKGAPLTQLWNGRVLPKGAVRALKGAKGARVRKFGVQLFRGRNDFEVRMPGAADEFRFALFYKSTLVEWLESLVKALILVVVVKTFVVQAFFIPTGSMEETLFPSDYILVEKVTGLFGKPKRGDIIVFQYPEDPTKDFIKRMVADAGETLEIRRKRFLLDGQCLDEPYVVHQRPETFPPGFGPLGLRDNLGPFKVPEAHSFAMGDNRDNSKDSRFWGPLPDYRLKGRALAIYWPPRRIGLVRPARGTPSPDCAPVRRPG